MIKFLTIVKKIFLFKNIKLAIILCLLSIFIWYIFKFSLGF